MPDGADVAGGGLSDEHHSWIESFFGKSARDPAPKSDDSGGGGILSSIGSALSGAADAVGNAASAAVHTVVDVGEKVVSTATDLSSKAIHAVAETGASVAEKVVDAVPLPDSVKSGVKDVIEFDKGVVEGVADGTKGLIDGVAHLAGAVVNEGVDLATSEKARESAAATVGHGLSAVGSFAKEAVTDPSRALHDAGSAVAGAADKVVGIGKAIYHSYEEAAAAGHGAEWLGKATGQVGVAVAGAVLTDGASLAEEGAAVGGEAMMLAADGAKVAQVAEVAEVAEGGATVARVAEEADAVGAVARGGARARRGAEAAEDAEGLAADARVDPAAPKDPVQRSPTDPRETRPLGNIAPHNEQGLALRDAAGARTSESEHILSRANIAEQTRNPATGVSSFDHEAYREATTLKLDRATALEKTPGDNAAWRALKNSGGAPSEAELEASGLEAAMKRTLEAARKVGDKSVTEESVNLAGHGELGSVFEAGAADAKAAMQGVSEEEIDALLDGMENKVSVDGRFAAPKGMGLPLEEAEEAEVAGGGAARARSPGGQSAGAGKAPKGTRGRLFEETTTTGDPNLPAGEGFTDKYGNVTYSTQGTQAEQDLVRIHEQVHSFLSPKLKFLREFRADLGQAAYEKSQLLRYMEEALAETVAQLSVNGAKGVFEGLRFPLKNGYVTIGGMATEAAIGTVVVGGTAYAISVVAK